VLENHSSVGTQTPPQHRLRVEVPGDHTASAGRANNRTKIIQSYVEVPITFTRGDVNREKIKMFVSCHHEISTDHVSGTLAYEDRLDIDSRQTIGAGSPLETTGNRGGSQHARDIDTKFVDILD